MGEKTTFIKTMLKDFRVGAVTRSSRFVVRKVLKDVDFKNASVIVEYGAGDGIITKEILKKMGANTQLTALEANKDFTEKLKNIKDSRFTLRHEKVEDFLAKAENQNTDVIISGIPFTFIKPTDRKKIVKQTLEILKPGGLFIVYQNSILMMPYLKKYFSSVKTSFEPRNFLPYFIMKAKK